MSSRAEDNCLTTWAAFSKTSSFQKSDANFFSVLIFHPSDRKPHSNSINQLYHHHRYLSLSLPLSRTQNVFLSLSLSLSPNTLTHTHLPLSLSLSHNFFLSLSQDKSSSVHLFLSLRDFQDRFRRPCRRRRQRRRRFWVATFDARSCRAWAGASLSWLGLNSY